MQTTAHATRAPLTGSAAIMHASHNLYVQGFFDRVTVDTGPTLADH